MTDTEIRLKEMTLCFYRTLDISQADYNILMALPANILEAICEKIKENNKQTRKEIAGENYDTGYDNGYDKGLDEGGRQVRRQLIAGLEDEGI